jgi:hypothetical protein
MRPAAGHLRVLRITRSFRFVRLVSGGGNGPSPIAPATTTTTVDIPPRQWFQFVEQERIFAAVISCTTASELQDVEKVFGLQSHALRQQEAEGLTVVVNDVLCKVFVEELKGGWIVRVAVPTHNDAVALESLNNNLLKVTTNVNENVVDENVGNDGSDGIGSHIDNFVGGTIEVTASVLDTSAKTISNTMSYTGQTTRDAMEWSASVVSSALPSINVPLPRGVIRLASVTNEAVSGTRSALAMLGEVAGQAGSLIGGAVGSLVGSALSGVTGSDGSSSTRTARAARKLVDMGVQSTRQVLQTFDDETNATMKTVSTTGHKIVHSVLGEDSAEFTREVKKR